MTEAETKRIKKGIVARLLASVLGVVILLLTAFLASYLVAQRTAMDIARNEGHTGVVLGRLTLEELCLGPPPDYAPTKFSTYLVPRWVFKWRLGDGIVMYEVISILGSWENGYFRLEPTDDLVSSAPDPEELFEEHLAFTRQCPIPSEENPAEMVGVLGGNKSTQHIVDLLSPDGLALLCKKARECTVEERLIATRLYSWYTMWAIRAGGRDLSQPAATLTIVAFPLRCAQLAAPKKMLELCDGLKSLEIPPNVRHLYEDIGLNVDAAKKEFTRQSGLDLPTEP